MPAQHNSVRVIAGRWRGRKLSFPDVEGLRPTPDRVRETLFNWLMPVIPGARCLDLFAGSGALGFEAASRGADQVVMVESQPQAYRSLADNIARLAADNIVLRHQDAMHYLAAEAQPFDVVFLDPPFQSRLLGEVCRRLDSGGWLRPGAFIYVELSKHSQLREQIPWRQRKARTAGQVAYALYQVEGG